MKKIFRKIWDVLVYFFTPEDSERQSFNLTVAVLSKSCVFFCLVSSSANFLLDTHEENNKPPRKNWDRYVLP